MGFGVRTSQFLQANEMRKIKMEAVGPSPEGLDPLITIDIRSRKSVKKEGMLL